MPKTTDIFNTHIEHCIIADVETAMKYGFNIEGPIAFIFNVGCTVACLGYVEFESHWQFDICNENLNVWQFEEKDLTKALARAEEIALSILTVYSSLDEYQKKTFDVVKYLEWEEAKESLSGNFRTNND